MKPKHADLVSSNLFYCFVDLLDNPSVYVIPSAIVAEAVGKIHEIWLTLPGKGGRPHRDSNVRRLVADYSRIVKSDHEIVMKYSKGWLDNYKDNWDILGLG